MSEALSFAEIKLALLQGFLGTLALSNVLDCAEQFVGPPRCISLRIAWHRAPALGSYAVDCAHFPIGTNDPKFSVGTHSGKKVLVYSPVERPAIFRVDHLAYRRQIHRTFLRSKAKDAVGFVRPDHDIRLEIPF